MPFGACHPLWTHINIRSFLSDVHLGNVLGGDIRDVFWWVVLPYGGWRLAAVTRPASPAGVRAGGLAVDVEFAVAPLAGDAFIAVSGLAEIFRPLGGHFCNLGALREQVFHDLVEEVEVICGLAAGVVNSLGERVAKVPDVDG